MTEIYLFIFDPISGRNVTTFHLFYIYIHTYTYVLADRKKERQHVYERMKFIERVVLF